MLVTIEVLILRRQLFHWLDVSFPTLRAAITSWYALIVNALERQPFPYNTYSYSHLFEASHLFYSLSDGVATQLYLHTFGLR